MTGQSVYIDGGEPKKASLFAGLSWLVIAIEAAYRGTLIYLAYARSPTYPWERFARNVGDPRTYIAVDDILFLIGAALAVVALLHPRRTRAAAIFALLTHLLLLLTIGAAFEREGLFHSRLLNY